MPDPLKVPANDAATPSIETLDVQPFAPSRPQGGPASADIAEPTPAPLADEIWPSFDDPRQ